MTRQVSLDAMRLLRLNMALSASLQQARQDAAVISTQSVTMVAPNMPNQVSPVASSNQWSSMASFPFATNNSMNHCNWAAEQMRRVLAQPTMGRVQARWVENQCSTRASRAGITENPVPVVQYLQQQQTLRRDGARFDVSDSHGVNGFTSPPPRSIPQDLVASSATCAQLPAVLSCATDGIVLTKSQVFLRMHIEAFAATPLDVLARVRGRHKQIRLHQIGIRCCHCAHLAPNQRGKGAVFFPSSTMGLYQAAQNMNSTHLQCGTCPEMLELTKTAFAQLLGTKTAGSSSMGGRAYWRRCALQMGLVDTEHGIFVVGAIPEGTSPI
jgi:hypothetical protein